MTVLADLGPIIQRRARWILIVGGVVLLAAVAMVLRGGRLATGTIHGLEAERADLRAERALGMSTDMLLIAVFQTDDVAKIDTALAPLRADSRVLAVIPPSTQLPQLRGRMVNRSHGAAYALIALAGNEHDAAAAFPDVRETVVASGLPVTMTGSIPFHHDLDAMLRRDLVRAEAIALPIALVVLLLVFRTPLAAVLPVAVGALAVLGGISIILALSHVMEIASYTLNVASLIGLGVAIDYSLFTVSRYREELAAGNDYPTALANTLRTTGRMIAFSGLAVATGLGGLCCFRGSYLQSMGLGGAIVVALAVLCAVTILPALLVVLGPRIHAGQLRARPIGVARRLAHPWRVILPTLAVLLVMAFPLRGLRMASVDTSVLPPSAEARRGLMQLRAAFPDLARTRITIAADRPADLAPLAARIERTAGVAKVERAADTLLIALTDAPPQSEAAQGIVRNIRAASAGVALVGGQTASDIDSAAFLAAHTPYAIAFVVGVMVVVLYGTFRSAVLPLKAVLLNVLSIAASLGGMIWVFQSGHLFVSHGRPIDPSVPILLFCISFGLSMDYHVLMLTRIRESYLQHGDNTRAVITGLERSAGLITSAAAIMVTVFGAFALARFVVIRSVGFGLALAVALDATLIRLRLVPATMKLLGRWNWWPASAPRS